MQTIYKYPAAYTEEFSLALPKNAKILSVQVQWGEPKIWALVDPEEPLLLRKFFFGSTEGSIPTSYTKDALVFIGTIQLGAFVFHLFEVSNGL